jgi:hypothetical protein
MTRDVLSYWPNGMYGCPQLRRRNAELGRPVLDFPFFVDVDARAVGLTTQAEIVH